ncbi:MAG: error-prone DNA polymerase [Proteobacteria bacterium]|nr:error-prone DNA polymerase [Pseudomonadota bacterium]
MPYAELAVTTNFTFLTGASHPEEMVERAAELGLAALAITDRNTLAGVVRAHVRLRELRREATRPLAKLIIGARLAFTDTPLEIIALAPDRPAYAQLCRLLTLGKRRAQKGGCELTLDDLCATTPGLILIACPPDPLAPQHPHVPGSTRDLDEHALAVPAQTREVPGQARDMGEAPAAAPPAPTPRPGAGKTLPHLQRLTRRFGTDLSLAAAPRYDGRDRDRFAALAALADKAQIPLAATGDVLMHRARRRRLADILTCIRTRRTIETLGRLAQPNAERRLRPPAEMARIFAAHPQALARTMEIANRCTFSLDELAYEYPGEGNGEPPQARLERLARAGLDWRYPEGASEKAKNLVTRELALIARLNYAPYFLTVHDIVAFARSRGILCQGRGSAANSVVCYALGVTEIAPETISMVFERFVSEARDEPPDIDVDFEHERREEVIQHIYRKYGRHRAGLCATVIHFRSRAALREVGRAMGLSADITAALAGQVWGWSREAIAPERLREIGLDPADRRLVQTMELVAQIIGFPRHLSQHVGGFVITAGRLDELVPIENAAMADRTVIEWDKDDIDALGILKVDVLGLGMLTCIRKAFDLIASHHGTRYTLATLPQEDPATYDMLCRADSLGVFQVESRAQMNFLPRMQPRCFYDLVIEVAIIRPGPIQGDMVHPYIRRRQGLEAVEFPSDELREVLGRTLGVPLFQEQAMRIAIVAAGFSPEEADRLRRSLATFRRTGAIGDFRDRFIEGMCARGYERAFAERCFGQIEGFGEYGFPESHAASFALLVYASAWLKRHHPAAFACALLNSQPMGFYAPAQIVRDVREHGVEVRPVCVNASYWDCTLEPSAQGADGRGLALRLGLRQVKGLRREDGQWISAARGNGYADVEALQRRAGLARAAITKLANADAFASSGLARREALWAARALTGDAPLPLFPDGEGLAEPAPRLPAPSPGEQVVEDYRALRLSLRAHPLALLRERLGNGHTATRIAGTPDGARIAATGLVITRQRPGTASGVIFLTLEDETGVINVIVWPKVYERFRRAVIAGRLLRITGKLQREGAVSHLIAGRIEDLSPWLDRLGAAPGPAGTETRPTPPRARHPREQARRLFPSRDFH